MRRRSPIIVLALALLAAGLLAAAGFYAGGRVTARTASAGTDDLEWLRTEFGVTGGEMDRVRELHEGYLPKCHEYCARIAAAKRELNDALAKGTNAWADVDRALAEIGTARAQCQSAMLRHFLEVSRAMPAEQGRRYLEEMQRLTLGAHERVENAMSKEAESHAGHDHHH